MSSFEVNRIRSKANLTLSILFNCVLAIEMEIWRSCAKIRMICAASRMPLVNKWELEQNFVSGIIAYD